MSTASAICSRFPLGPEAGTLLRDDLSPRQFLDALREAGLRVDALRLVAHAFPKRSAVWWGVLGLDRIGGETSRPPSEADALEAARRWVIEPTEEHRRAALPAAELAGYDTPAGALAAASFFSGGSVAPPELPPSPPGDHVTAELVFAALVSLGSSAGEQASDRFDTLLQLAVELTERKHLWPGAASS